MKQEFAVYSFRKDYHN